MRVILIGAGISGALISVLLRRQFGPAIKLAVYDKGKSVGKKIDELYFSVNIIL